MFLVLALASSLAQSAPPENMADIFIGSLSVEDGTAILTRCDLGNSRYRLRDARGHHAVADYLRTGQPAVADVFGVYSETNGQDSLQVIAIEGRDNATDCHLTSVMAPLPEAVPDPAFVGHYYLSGLHETGSELLLRVDGHFEWFLSRGAEDMATQGSWVRQGKEIVLTAQKPVADRPMFALARVAPWLAPNEQRLLEDRRSVVDGQVRAACPFFTDDFVSSASPVSVAGEHPTLQALQAKAAETRAEALIAKSRLEALARQIMAKGAANSADMDVAQPALMAWFNAREAAERAASTAGLPAPALGDPNLPAACTLPPPVKLGAPATWIGGKGVIVRDRVSGEDIRGVTAALHFVDGHAVTITTGTGGFGYLANADQPGAIKAVTLTAAGHEQNFDLPPLTTGVVQITVESDQLTAPAFDSMRLTIDHDDLIIDNGHAARYQPERRPGMHRCIPPRAGRHHFFP